MERQRWSGERIDYFRGSVHCAGDRADTCRGDSDGHIASRCHQVRVGYGNCGGDGFGGASNGATAYRQRFQFRTQQFNANVTGNANTAVTWQVNGTAGGSQKLGFISSNGLYVAPSAVPTKSDGKGNTTTTTVTVTAVSQADTSASGHSTVTIVPDNANAQSGAIELGTSGSNAKDFNTNTSTHTTTCCGGTLGSLVTRGGVQYILSNNHILARSDAGTATNGATAGDAIVQPGLIDTTTCTTAGTTTVANLTQFFNLQSSPAPNIDAAIAQVVSGKVDTTGKIVYLGATTDANGVPVPAAPLGGAGTTVTIGRGAGIKQSHWSRRILRHDQKNQNLPAR